MSKTFALVATALLGGCSLIPTYERPAAPVAPQWPATVAAPGGAIAAVDLPWQDFVGDANLRQVIGLALQTNRDLRVAVLAIEQARAAYDIRAADQLPNLNLGATGLRQPNPNGNGHITGTYTAGLSMPSWELDFFGRVASLKESAQSQFLATQEARKTAQTSLIAAVASSWLSLQANDQLLSLTQRTLETRQESLRLTQLRFDNGASSALDLRLAQSLAAAASAALAQQQRLRALDLNALTLLVGQPIPPQHLVEARGVGGTPSPLLRDVPAGLPSDLLTRRPDVRQAEAQLLAANANIGAARAAFFPRISLTASAGSASSDLGKLLQHGTWGWTMAPQALLPIFDAGRNQANLDSAKAGRDIALAQYEKAIQVAFREVSDALAGSTTLADQVRALQTQVTAEEDRMRLADLRYKNGIASYLDLMDAQRSLFATQQVLAQTRLAEQQNKVALYKVLGGGWSEAATAR